jgi:GTPase SAR1 family protein
MIFIIDLQMQKNYDYVLKFVIVGSSSVGKSSILRRFADDEFEESYISTIGIDFRFKYSYYQLDPCTSRITM